MNLNDFKTLFYIYMITIGECLLLLKYSGSGVQIEMWFLNEFFSTSSRDKHKTSRDL